MTRKDYEEFQRFRRSWSGEISSQDSDYQDYAGASLEDALRLAKIDTLLFLLPENHVVRTLLKILRVYLIQKKKAVFCSVGMNEVSVLGALKAEGLGQYDVDTKIRKLRVTVNQPER